MSLKTNLDRLAEAIARHAIEMLDAPDGKKPKEDKKTPINLQESVDAFKALSQYYAIQMKRPPKKTQDGADEPTFADFSDAVRPDEQQVPGGRASN